MATKAKRNNSKDTNWGGPREGSGAPRKWEEEETRSLTVRLPVSVLGELDKVAQENNINKAEALVMIINPTLYKRVNRKILQVHQPPQKEQVVATLI